jgi:hypothetical protein
MVGGDGEYTASGTYETVTGDELGMTWAWSHEPASVSNINVKLHAEGDGCRMVFKHTGLMHQEDMDRHQEGWGGCLAMLQAVLA